MSLPHLLRLNREHLHFAPSVTVECDTCTLQQLLPRFQIYMDLRELNKNCCPL